MATTNGTTDVPSLDHASETTSELNLPLKRKRDDLSSTTSPSAPSPSLVNTTPRPPEDVQARITDYVQVLESYDTHSSIITRPIPESEGEPPAKRKRPDADVDSIYHRALSGIYSSLNHVLVDVKDVCSSILGELENARLPESKHDDNTDKITAVKHFRRKAEELVSQEQLREEWRSTGRVPKAFGSKNFTTDITSAKTFTTLTTNPEDNLMALTLLSNMPSDARSGSRQGPRQLFSSIIKSVKDANGNLLSNHLGDSNLPQNITSTQICHIPSSIVDGKLPAQTLGHLFTNTTATLPTLSPSHIGRTKSNTVGWYRPGSLEEYPLKNDLTYPSQSVAVGQWLDYEGSAREQLARQRRKSTSKNSMGISLLTNEDKLELMFKNAFNSFGPTRDDTDAIVPQAVLSRMYWQKKGEQRLKRFASKMETATAILDPIASNDSMTVVKPVESDTVMGEAENSNNTDHFQDVIDFVENQMIDPELVELDVKSVQDKEVEEVLDEISELLETLNSYQRNRHLQPVTQRLSDSVPIAKPSEIEIATYDTLKAQLAFMITTLPPYAVAKLNSDQLSELQISTKIPVYTINHKGVMDDDVETQRIRAAENAARSARVAPIPAPTRMSSDQGRYGNQYSGTSRPSTSASQSQYYNQTPVRPPAPRVPATTQPYVPRLSQPSYQGSSTSQYTGASYPHQQSRQQGSFYNNTHYNASTPQTYAPPSSYANAPMTAPQGSQRYSVASAGYQPRVSTQPLRQYASNDSLSNQHNSPQKTVFSPQAIPTPLSRQFSTPTPAPPQVSHDYYGASNISNGNSQSYAQNSGMPHVGATGFKTWMDDPQQSALMDRQRAQLAQQQQETLYRSQAPAHSGYTDRPVN